MKKGNGKSGRISVRLTPNQELVLNELRNSLGTTYSVLLRAIVLDFLERNGDVLESIISKKMEDNGLDTETGEEEVNGEE